MWAKASVRRNDHDAGDETDPDGGRDSLPFVPEAPEEEGAGRGAAEVAWTLGDSTAVGEPDKNIHIRTVMGRGRRSKIPSEVAVVDGTLEEDDSEQIAEGESSTIDIVRVDLAGRLVSGWEP